MHGLIPARIPCGGVGPNAFSANESVFKNTPVRLDPTTDKHPLCDLETGSCPWHSIFGGIPALNPVKMEHRRGRCVAITPAFQDEYESDGSEMHLFNNVSRLDSRSRGNDDGDPGGCTRGLFCHSRIFFGDCIVFSSYTESRKIVAKGWVKRNPIKTELPMKQTPM